MKKLALSLISILLIFTVIGCTWEMPKALQISGTAGIDNLSINLDLTRYITKELEKQNQWQNSFEINDETHYMTITMQECINISNPLTFLLHIKIPFPVPINEIEKELDILLEDYMEEHIENFLADILDEEYLDNFIDEFSVGFGENLDLEAIDKIFVLIDENINETIEKIIADIQNNKDDFELPDDIPIIMPDMSELLEDLADDIIEAIRLKIIGNINEKINPSGPPLSVVGRSVFASVQSSESSLSDLIKDAIVETIKNETKDAVKDEIYKKSVEVDDDDTGGWTLVETEIKLPLDNIPDYLLDNKFDIPNLQAKIFISVKDGDEHIDDEFFKLIDLDLDIFDETVIGETKKIDASEESGLEFKNHQYIGTSLPQGGIVFEIANIIEDIFDKEREGGAAVKAFIEKGKEIDLKYLGKDYDFSLEMVLMLPIEIRAEDDIEFILTPEDLGISDTEDLFGRGSSDKLEEYIRSANFTIKFNKDLFHGVKLEIEEYDKPGGFKMDYGIISSRQFGCNLTNDQIKQLDTVNPFVPQIKLTMKKGDLIAVQRDLKIESLTLKADINVRYDF